MIAAFVVLAAAPSCGPLDLQTALALAATRSDEVTIKQAELLGAQADLAIAKAIGILPLSSATFIVGPAPDAHGSYLDANSEYFRSIKGLGPFIRFDVNLVQPLWTWGQLTAAKDAAQAGVQAHGLSKDDTLHLVQLRVLQTYWGASLARRLLALASEIEGAVKDAEHKIEQSLAAADGSVTLEDRYRVAIFKGELAQRKAEAQKGLKFARAALAATLAAPEPGLVLKDEPLPASPDTRLPTQAEVSDEAQRNRPDLRALDQAVIAVEQQAKASWAAQLPQLFAAGLFTYSRAWNRDIQYNPWIKDDFNQLSGGVGIGVRQSLSFPTLHAQEKKAQAEVVRLKAQREGLARLVVFQAVQALADLQAAVDRYAAAQGSLSAGRAWFRSAGLNFGAGVSDARAVVDAYTAYSKSQADGAQTTYELLLARGHLDHAIGRSLAHGEATCVLP